MNYLDKEKSSTLTTLSRHLRFLDTPAVAESTSKSSFDPAELLAGKMTIYLILPPEHLRAQVGLLRMWIGSMMRAVVKGGTDNRTTVDLLLDEAGALGQMNCVDGGLDKLRSYGVRLYLVYQSIGQTKLCFAVLTSTALQYGVPVETLARKFEFSRFEPSGWTKNPELRHDHSIVDYLFRWLGLQCSASYRKERLDLLHYCPAGGSTASGDGTSNNRD